MYYVIKPSGVVSASSLTKINLKLNAKMSDDEFTIVGGDFVAKLTDVDIDFVRDKHKMENLLFTGFFKKDNSVKFMTLFILILNFVQLLMIGSIGK